MELSKIKKQELLQTLLQLTQVMSDPARRGEVWKQFYAELTAEIDKRNYQNKGKE